MGLGGDDRRLWFLSTSSSNAHLISSLALQCPNDITAPETLLKRLGL